MRQHVNPLSRFFQLPLELEETNIIFENNKFPLHLDIGSARGKFLIGLAQRNSSWNYVGVEIRKLLVTAAEKDRENLELNNLKFFFCNANISLENWLRKLKPDQLQRVSIQFPDPWFKRRHYKRRVLQLSLLIEIARSMPYGGELFIQSDVFEVIKPMAKLIEKSNYFHIKKKNNISDFIQENPFGYKTEREEYVLAKGLPIYRILYIRNRETVSEDIS